MSALVRPIHRQFGSKARVAGKILALLPPGKRIWCELFAGTASVTLAKAPHTEEHLNDLNGEIYNLFSLLRDDAARARLIDQVEMTPWSQEEFRACRKPPTDGDHVEQARRYLVRSWQGINGDSAKGTGWASFDGTSKARPRIWADLPPRIALVAHRLKSVAIHRKPALKLLEQVGRYPHAICFADPPYPLHTIEGGRSNYSIEMNDLDHVEFADALRDVKCSVLLTMNPGTVYDGVLHDWHRTSISVQGLGNRIKREVVMTNYLPPADLLAGAGGA